MTKIFLVAALLVLISSSCQNYATKEKEPVQSETNSINTNKTLTVEKPPASSILNNKNDSETDVKNGNSPTKIVKQEKRIRYLFFANGGLVGYFSDGSVVGCPRCDLSKENVAAMLKEKSMGTYAAKKDYLLVDGKEKVELYEEGKISRDWAIVDYKKIVDF